MKTTRLYSLLILFITNLTINAQIGINASNPQSTLDVVGNGSNTSSKDGILVPRISKQQLASKTAGTYNTAQNGALVYVTDVTAPSGTTPSLAQVANVNVIGYYYFDGTLWVASSPPMVNMYNSNGNLTGNRVVTQGSSTLSFTGTAVNGFSVDGNTFSVDTANNRIGIGTPSPGISAKLQVDATNQGMLIPRVALTSSTDGTTILSPAKGLMVYNTTTSASIREGFFVNYGTSVSPSWRSFESFDNTTWTLENFYDTSAASFVDQDVSSVGTVNNINLGMSITVTVPAFTEAKVVSTYNVPVGTTSLANGLGGYFGIRFLKNGSELSTGSRKYSIPAESLGAQSRMVSVGNSVGDLISNNTPGSVNITYTLNGYVEVSAPPSATAAVRFNMWSSSGANFNWGRSYMKVEIYTRPL